MIMKTIVIDGEVLCENRMDGIHRFMIETLGRIDKLLPGSELDIKLVHSKGRSIQNLELRNIEVVDLGCPHKGMRLLALPQYVKKVGGIYCSMSNDVIAYKKSIITIMDLIPLSPLAKYPAKSLMRMKMVYAKMKKYAGQVVTISNESKKDIVNKLGIPADKVTLVGTGYEHMDRIKAADGVLGKYNLRERGFYYAMGNQYPYKNFEWVRQAAKRNPNEQFVVAGKVTNIESHVDDSDSNLMYLGYISDEEHKALISSAKAFIHPSKLEGFGIPPLEALSLGTPVIIARASCLPEIYGGTAHYIDPDNVDVDLNELMKEEVEAPDKLLAKYTWDNVASDWMKIFKETEL